MGLIDKELIDRIFTAIPLRKKHFVLFFFGLGAVTVFFVSFNLIRNYLTEQKVRQNRMQGLYYESGVEAGGPPLETFKLPERISSFDGQRFYLWRQPQSRWSEEEVKRFWLDVERVDIDQLSRDNKEVIGKILDGVP